MTGDLRVHEADLLRELRRIEVRTPFVEALAQRTRGAVASADSKSRTARNSPHLEGVAFRAWKGTRWVESATFGLGKDNLARAADDLLAQLASHDSSEGPPGAATATTGVFDRPVPRPMRDLGNEGALSWAQQVLSWTREEPDIKFAQATVQWSEDERYYLNSTGANCVQRLARVMASILAVAAENGRSEFYADAVGRLGGQEVLEALPEAKVRKVCAAARALLRAKAPPRGPMNVLLDPGVTGTFVHESFGHGTEADQFVRNRSYLQPLLGTMVGPEFLTLVDDGSIPDGWGSIRFDDEGHLSQRTPLVQDGRFVGALHDRSTAAALGAHPTGNTRRANFLGQAFVRMTNTLVEPRDLSYDELIEEARNGIVLERWLSGIEDPLGGRMQIKTRQGHLIENGKVTDLVSSVVLSGRVLEFLRDIRGVGSAEPLDLTPASCGKGHSDLLPVGSGGPYLLSRAVVGPS